MGEEKVKRFYEIYPKEIIDEFYSDSYSDLPLANISKKAFLIKKGQIPILKKDINSIRITRQEKSIERKRE